MKFIEKIKSIKDYKMILIGAIGAFCIALILALNLNNFQMMKYTRAGETTKVIELLRKDVGKQYKSLSFKSGMEHLLKEIDHESQHFIEENFKYFDAKWQLQILNAYNENNISMKNNLEVIDLVIKTDDMSILKPYINKLDVMALEVALKEYFGENPRLSQDVVERLYKVLSLQTKKITLDKFSINMYELMRFPHNGDLNSMALKLLDYIEPIALYDNLTTTLKTQPIEIDEFALWISIFNKKKIISSTDYASFTTSYGNIRRFQEQYKSIILQEVDLLNVKQMTDVQTEELTIKGSRLEKEIEALKEQIQKDDLQLRELKNYKTMDLYVLDQFENGDVEAAIPEKSWLFGTYKPSSQRLRLRLADSIVTSQGVMPFDVYNKGYTEDGTPYYIEVSGMERATIDVLTKGLQEARTSLVEKENELIKINQDIEQIRKNNNYAQTIDLIEDTESRKQTIQLELKKEKVVIQNLFQIGELVIELN